MTDKLRVEPQAQAALDRADAQREAGNLAAALSECEAALQAAPHWAEAHNLRGIILDEMGRTDDAIAAYREALRLDPTLTDAAENLQELQAEKGRPWPRWKRVAAIALPVAVVAVVAIVYAVLEARRGPD